MTKFNADHWTLREGDLAKVRASPYLENRAALAENPLFRAILWRKKQRARKSALMGWSVVGLVAAVLALQRAPAGFRFPVDPWFAMAALFFCVWSVFRSKQSALEQAVGVPQAMLLDLHAAAYPPRELAAGFLAAQLWISAVSAALSVTAMLAVPLGAMLFPFALGASQNPYLVFWLCFFGGVMIVIHGPFRSAQVLNTLSYNTEYLRSKIIPKKDDLECPSERRIARIALLILVILGLPVAFAGLGVRGLGNNSAALPFATWIVGLLVGLWLGRRARRKAPQNFAAMERDFRDLLYWASIKEHEKDAA